jgi:hypothetical protein
VRLHRLCNNKACRWTQTVDLSNMFRLFLGQLQRILRCILCPELSIIIFSTVYSDYPGTDYSVCGLSVNDSFFNIPSRWFIKLHTISIYTEYLVHKSEFHVDQKRLQVRPSNFPFPELSFIRRVLNVSNNNMAAEGLAVVFIIRNTN